MLIEYRQKISFLRFPAYLFGGAEVNLHAQDPDEYARAPGCYTPSDGSKLC